jgi:hypothetical protein
MRFTEAECIAQNRCPEHQSIRLDTCPLKHQRKYVPKTVKERKVSVKHICADNTKSLLSKGWISYSCSCGLRWGRPHV